MSKTLDDPFAMFLAGVLLGYMFTNVLSAIANFVFAILEMVRNVVAFCCAYLGLYLFLKARWLYQFMGGA